uniref:Uncharacterized protein n=1 Tax=Lygus hesperus TaxID=30085 RepID=A0A146LFU7_LYGHE
MNDHCGKDSLKPLPSVKTITSSKQSHLATSTNTNSNIRITQSTISNTKSKQRKLKSVYPKLTGFKANLLICKVIQGFYARRALYRTYLLNIHERKAAAQA